MFFSFPLPHLQCILPSGCSCNVIPRICQPWAGTPSSLLLGWWRYRQKTGAKRDPLYLSVALLCYAICYYMYLCHFPGYLNSQGLFILASWMIWVAIPSKSRIKFPGHRYWRRWILVQFRMGCSLSKDEQKRVSFHFHLFLQCKFYIIQTL